MYSCGSLFILQKILFHVSLFQLFPHISFSSITQSFLHRSHLNAAVIFTLKGHQVRGAGVPAGPLMDDRGAACPQLLLKHIPPNTLSDCLQVLMIV